MTNTYEGYDEWINNWQQSYDMELSLAGEYYKRLDDAKKIIAHDIYRGKSSIDMLAGVTTIIVRVAQISTILLTPKEAQNFRLEVLEEIKLFNGGK